MMNKKYKDIELKTYSNTEMKSLVAENNSYESMRSATVNTKIAARFLFPIKKTEEGMHPWQETLLTYTTNPDIVNLAKTNQMFFKVTIQKRNIAQEYIRNILKKFEPITADKYWQGLATFSFDRDKVGHLLKNIHELLNEYNKCQFSKTIDLQLIENFNLGTTYPELDVVKILEELKMQLMTDINGKIRYEHEKIPAGALRKHILKLLDEVIWCMRLHHDQASYIMLMQQ